MRVAGRISASGSALLPVALVVCLAAACSWTDADDAIEPARTASTAKPAVRLIAYTKYLPNGDWEVWVADFGGRGKRRLAAGGGAAVSPDGRWVAYQGGCRSGVSGDCPDLYVVRSAGGAPRLLARGVSDPIWSSHSNRVVAYQAFSIFRGALLSIDARSGARVTLVRGDLHNGWSIAPGSDRVAYALTTPREKTDIFVVGIHGGEPRRLTRDGHSAQPVWGPDAIAFARLVPYRGWGRHEIWRIGPDGRGRRTVTGPLPKRLLGQGFVGLIPIAWSGNGRRLLAGWWNEFGAPPYAVDPGSGAIREIGEYDFHAWPEGISRDGRYVLVSDTGVEVTERTRVEVVPYTGGRGRVIARRAGRASWNR